MSEKLFSHSTSSSSRSQGEVGSNNINYKGESEGQRSEEKTYESSEATFTQNCFPSSNKINEAFSMGARGGSEISALEEPNVMVGR